MTICVGIKVQDCIVFAADSTSSLQAEINGGMQVVNTYDHGNKLFNLKRGLPIAAMTAGIGNFGPSSISTISKDFRCLLDDNTSEYHVKRDDYHVRDIADAARDYFFHQRYQKLASKPVGAFQYWVGGYSSGAEMGEIWTFVIRDGVCDPPVCVADQDVPSGMSWGGAPEAINRLVLGYSQGLRNALHAGGLAEDKVGAALEGIAQHTQANLVHPAMPVADAVALARFLAESTKQFVRFLPGGNTVGGDIDIAVITKHENFKWIDRKHFYTGNLNPLETDHA